ncbi:MAG: NUDIX domain-containing protein [Patescibacteria group bacterium]
MLTDKTKAHFMFSDDFKFLQKVIVFHPTDKTKFLALKRQENDVSRPGCWDLCGGNVAWSEIHDTALTREIKEESGLTVSNISPLQIKTTFEAEKQIYYLFIGYIARAVSDTVILSLEHTEYKWVTKEEFLQFKSADFLMELVSKI